MCLKQYSKNFSKVLFNSWVHHLIKAILHKIIIFWVALPMDKIFKKIILKEYIPKFFMDFKTQIVKDINHMDKVDQLIKSLNKFKVYNNNYKNYKHDLQLKNILWNIYLHIFLTKIW